MHRSDEQAQESKNSGNKEDDDISDWTITTIKSLGKIEALIGSTIIGLVGLIAAKFQLGEMVDPTILGVLMILIVLILSFQLMYYLKFIIEKGEWRKDKLAEAKITNDKLDREIRKLELKIQLQEDEKDGS